MTKRSPDGPRDTMGGRAGGARQRRSGAAPIAPPAVEGAIPRPAAERAAQALWAVLLLLALARASLAFVPSMWGWALNPIRFLPPTPAWALWLSAALALIPALSRGLAPAFALAGDSIARAPWLAYPLWALAAGVAAWLSRDQVQFVGDFLLRQGSTIAERDLAFLFPQALPLDLFLHYNVARALGNVLAVGINQVETILGAVEAGVLAILAVAFARTLKLSRVAGFAAAATVLLGGYLGLFTGYGKGIREMCVLTAAVAVFGLGVAREGKGLLRLGVCVAVALALHRSALVLLVPMLVAWALGFRHYGAEDQWRRPRVLVGLAVPLVALGVLAPRIVAAVRSIDRMHVAPAGADLTHLLSAAFGPLHLADVANLAILLAPLSPAAFPLALLLWRHMPRRTEGLFMVGLVAPFLAMLLFVHPRQGAFRDWDVFASSGVAIAIATAWLVGETLRSARRFEWVGVAAVLGALSPTAQWLLHHRDVQYGIRRAEAFLVEPPARPDPTRALAFNYLAVVYHGLGRLDEAADAFASAAVIAPSPRILYEWAVAEARRGDLKKSREVLRRVVAKAPEMQSAWASLAIVSFRLGDRAGAHRAVERALEIAPGDAAILELRRGIERAEKGQGPAP